MAPPIDDDSDTQQESAPSTPPVGLQFGIRSLLIVTSLVIFLLAWWSDHNSLRRQVVDLESRIARAEAWQDNHERLLMTSAIVGDAVADHTDIRLLADHVITPEHEYFKQVHDSITYPEVREPCDKCEISYFELTHTGIEGDPFDFTILSCDGVIIAVRRGESLNS